MAADRAWQALVDHVTAALEGAAAALPVHGGEPTAQVLELYGDALRLGIPVPGGVRAWARKAEIERAIDATLAEMATWSVPAHLDSDEASFAVKRRDAIESFRVAVLRVCLERGAAPRTLGRWTELEGACRNFDAELARRGTRQQAHHLLGARVLLLGARPWTNVLAEADAPPDDGELPAIDASDLPEPSNEVVAAYASRGLHRALVETFAAKNAAFAEDLADLLASMKEDRELDALVPRAWLDRFRPTSRALTFARPRVRAAAAGVMGEEEARRSVHELGEVAPSVAASLELDAATMHLRVYPGGTRLTRVDFGGTTLRAPNVDGVIWELTAPTSDAVHLSIHDAAGELFSTNLRFAFEP